jgi:hypothetical protein
VQAPPQITNRVGSVDVIVDPYQFYSPSVEPTARYLVSKVTVTNPRAQPTTISFQSAGQASLRFGAANSGVGLPSATSLTLDFAAGESRSFYIEPAGAGNATSLVMSAPDFADQSSTLFPGDPQAIFSAPAISPPLGSGSASVSIVLADRNSGREFPLGTSFGPLQIQLQSSNSQVVQVPATPVEFAPGDSRKSVTLDLKGRGDAIVSLFVPAAFAGNSPTRQDLVVSVR